ncbi:Ig-like domain-containing protein [Bacillus toyonensis]|uniref:Ig-like domain-containing protein n=1 Tax=Bacillus toyonensis TaxID=155322 RepID=UPI003D2584C5
MKKKNRRIDQLKPINVVATATIVATTLFTPVMDILPGQSSMAYAANQENIPSGSIMANAANQWSGLTLPGFNNATKQGFTKGTEYATVLNRGAITWGTSQQGAFPGVLEMKSRPRENHISTKFVILYKQAVTYDAATKSWGFVEGDGVFTDDTSKPTKPVGVVTVRKNIGPELDKWGVVQIVALPNRDGLRVYYNEELVFEVKYPLNGKVFPTSSIRINGKNTTLPAVPAMDIAGVNMVRDMSEWLSVSLKVNEVTDQDTKVIGTGKPGANISIVVDGKEIGTGKVDDQGNYTVDIPKQPGGKEIAVTLTGAGNTSKPVKTIVQSKAVILPNAPKVNGVTDQDTKVTGTGEGGSKVSVVVDGKEIGSGTIDEQGNFTVDIPKQPGGKEITVTLTDVAGNKSEATKINSKDTTAPEVPKVNEITDEDTKVMGTGEAGSKVSVVVDGKEIGSGTVDKEGNFTVDIPKQPGGKEIAVTLTDAAGNTGKPANIKVKEGPVTQEKFVNEAKQAIDQLFTDSIQANYSHDSNIAKKGAIQVHVMQQHITEAEEKVRIISDGVIEKEELQKEIERAQKLLKERENEQAGNLVLNGLFESGLNNWRPWLGSGAIAPGVQVNGGKSLNVIKINPNSSVEQVLSGLSPDTTYEFTVYAKAENNEKFSIGVKNSGTVNVSAPVFSEDYSQVKVRFKTGSNATAATIYIYNTGGIGSGYADVAIVKKVMEK